MSKLFSFSLAAIVIGMLCWTPALAGVDPPVVKVLDGSLGQIVDSAQLTVQDDKYFDAGSRALMPANPAYPVQNIVSFEFNEGIPIYLKGDFDATVQLTIYKTGADTNVVYPETKYLTIKYRTNAPYEHRATAVYNNLYRVRVKIVSISITFPSGSPTWDAVRALKLVNQLQAFPRYNFSNGNTIAQISDSAFAANSFHDDLPVWWTPSIGADEYDLEWTYIDSFALASGRYGTPSSPTARLLFDNNATRVSVTGTAYRVPLLYDSKGTLFYRVRAVQWQTGGGRKEAVWTTFNTAGHGRFAFDGHQDSLNWQATTSFAEEGKRKSVVQYYDGSLRGRQTVTKDNTVNRTIVAESFYDYQGRPVIQALPAPTLNTVLGYTKGFNKGFGSTEYDKNQFDSLANPALYGTLQAAPMDTASGASQYYSSNSAFRDSGVHKYVPNAEQFPFTETEYTQDNTGRINRQGGVGKDFRLGSGHETKYMYSTPDQRELDALFGTEVGDVSHYFKNSVRDANGQYSISYVDMRGRTIATALAGTPPDSIKLAKLSSNTGVVRTETISGATSVVIKDLVMEHQKSLALYMPDSVTFSYSLDPLILKAESCQDSICYDCLYDLEIIITDDRNNNNLPGGKAFDTVFHNFSLNAIDTTCNAGTGFSFSFKKYLPEGNYEITKKLSVSRSGMNYLRDSVFMLKNTCKTLDSFVVAQRAILAAVSECKPTCASCTDSLGSWTQYWLRFRDKNGIPEVDTAVYRNMALEAYATAQQECAELCAPVSEAVSIRKTMLMDMTPSSGQYANIDNEKDKYNIFYSRLDSSAENRIRDTLAAYTKVTTYKDADGNADMVFDESANKLVPPQALMPEVFAQRFKESWAAALLPLHPEYDKLVRYEQLEGSHQWDKVFEAVDTYAEAKTKGYLNPTGKNTSPYNLFNGSSPITDPLSVFNSLFKDSLELVLTKFRNAAGYGDISMWQMACVSVMCKGTSTPDCYNLYSTTTGHPFDPGYMCTGELDMAWRMYRQFYLDAKRKLVNHYISNCLGCMTTAAIVASGHQPNFSDAEELIALQPPADLPTTAAEAETIKQQYYESNCRAYAALWLKELAPCTQYDKDSLDLVIIPALIDICREGADSTHPYGSSSVRPSSPRTYRSFEAYLNHYNATHGSVTDLVNCNAYVLSAPKPYDQQAVNGNKPVYSKPDECECTNISRLYNLYKPKAVVYSGSFSRYLAEVYQTKATDSVLTLLLKLCGNPDFSAADCDYVSQPIWLPPVFQCNTNDVCVDCVAFSALDSTFKVFYPTKHPNVADSVLNDSVQLATNKLYEQFMNYRLGYSKTVDDYMNFKAQCGASGDTTRDKLNNLVAEYYKQYVNPVSRIVDLPMRTFAGNKTIAAGPKGVFDVNGNFIGNTIDSTVGQINESFAQVWNSSAVNQVVGTLSALPNGLFRLQLNSGQITPCDGIVGMRYYQFEIPTARLDAVRVGAGCFIDFGDGSRYKVASLQSTKTTMRATTGPGGGMLRYCDNVTPFRAYSIFHTYDSAVDHTITIYHSDERTREFYFDCSSDCRNMTGLKNLRGYIPPEILTFGFHSTQDSTFNRTSAIRNFSLVSNIEHLDLENGDVAGNAAYTAFLNNNFGSLANNHNLRSIWIDNSTSVPANQIRKISEYLPDLPGNFPKVNFLRILPYDSVFAGDLDLRLPNLRGLFIGGTSSMTSTQVDRLIHQVATGTLKDSGALVIYSPSERTSASDADISTLLAKHWYLQVGSATLYNNPFVNYTRGRPAPDSIRYENDFTDFVNAKLGTQFTLLEILNLYQANFGSQPNYCSSTNPDITLCGRAEPNFPVTALEAINNCSDSTFFIQSKAIDLYSRYTDSVKGRFDSAYRAKCMQAYKYERFTVRHTVSEYHYTLYYYDQGGNLVKTIPPAGVRANYDSLWLDSVRVARLAGQLKRPAHVLPTQYRYNTLNQVIAQKSPDGGKTEFWYDRLGRLTLSRNARQLGMSSAGNRYFSYTKYDVLGRITEVGQVRDTATRTIDDAFTRNEDQLTTWQTNHLNFRAQVTSTVYDTAYDFGGFTPRLVTAQQNVRNRVSYVMYKDTTGASSAYNNASYYSYDIHGNVDTLLQDYGYSGYAPNIMNKNGNRFKKFVYEYDLISGKVNKVTYQPGFNDMWIHRYFYDAENRLTEVETSTDNYSWEREAKYEYYLHGPLARTTLGQQQVQGIDYAYTLQGWLKGINSTGGTATHDIGGDGRSGSINQYTATDALGFNLNYFGGDYKPINPGVTPFPAYRGSGTNLGLPDSSWRPLYNGNISSMMLYNDRLEAANNGGGILYAYQYDQLNRLVKQDAFAGFDRGNNVYGERNTYGLSLKEDVSYDANGNIQTYNRNGGGSTMDQLTYHYYDSSNKLKRVNDAIDANRYGSGSNDLIVDIDDQTDSSNYVYDEIGNLILDKSEGNTQVKWNVYGKITEVTRTPSAKAPYSKMSYSYDAGGNRISKITTRNDGQMNYTWYVRDAQGNLMTSYTTKDSIGLNKDSLQKLYLIYGEQYIYGSSRLGARNNLLGVGVDGEPYDYWYYGYSGNAFQRGARQYELTNHLGNVLATISDRKFGVPLNDTAVSYYQPDIQSANDYYPFGMPSRVSLSNAGLEGQYRYGFNGKENDWLEKGWMNQVDYGNRVYDVRIGKFLSVDPLQAKYPWFTPYHFAGNNPTASMDSDGKDTIRFVTTRTTIAPFTGPSGVKIGGASYENHSIVVIQAPGKDIFYADLINSNLSAHNYPSPATTSVQFYPGHDGPNGQGGVFSGTGLTESGGLLSDGDFTSLAKMASPDLVDYLEKHNPDEFGSLKLHRALMKVEEVGRVWANAGLIFAGGIGGFTSSNSAKAVGGIGEATVKTESVVTEVSNIANNTSTSLITTGVKFSKHSLERLAQRGVTEDMAQLAISKGQKFYDPLNKSINYVLPKSFASGKSLLVGTNSLTGEVTTVIRSSKNLITKRFIPIK